MSTAQLTPSQTIGPFFVFALPWPDGPLVVAEGTRGAFRLAGRLLDGAGEPVADALVETWQADPEGRFPDGGSPPGGSPPGGSPTGWFRGFGRCPTDAEGRFGFLTVKPGPIPGPDGTQAPHVDVSVFARGLLRRLVTRVYFPDEAEANALDPVLSALPDAAARSTLVARPGDGGLVFDIHLQGDDETVFFAV
ncbi:MAG: protocatechuate 3,4-dioxygenase subunit alpha [Acidimicrobiales bacterium]